ncbi:type 1 glutamine amidotransferase [Halobium salinum]|uniref:Type 1 glutamine amidotransferase n=1 Tax=Halobium salinum TaxID=1364940 RepID=A0ABD5P7Y5_9EURY|nr:type 1 glutamine amidotransferase [Halobium salinum]
MSRPRLALLDASHGDSNTRRNFRRELDADLVEFAASEGELPPTGGYDEYDGVVVTGSRASVYWDEPWIRPLVEWVDGAAESGLPVLGVCFGHQVVAEALGGHVEAMEEFEIGYREVRRVGGAVEGSDADGGVQPDDDGARPGDGDDPLFAGIDDRFTVFTTHGDSVVDLPPGAQVLAENEYGVHGFRVGHAFGVQFHPEYDPETARAVTRGKEERLGTERVESVLAGVTDENYAAACEAKRLFENFVDYVERVRTDAGPDTDAGVTA